jgi:hypothetical protein
MAPFIRWWFIFCAILMAFIFFQATHLFEYLWSIDKTKITFVTLSLFSIVSMFIGVITYKLKFRNLIRYADYLPACNYAAQAMQGLGLIGTILGFMFMFQADISKLDPSNAESLKLLMFTMGKGFTTAVSTTLVGVATSLLLQLQLVNIGTVSDEE